MFRVIWIVAVFCLASSGAYAQEGPEPSAPRVATESVPVEAADAAKVEAAKVEAAKVEAAKVAPPTAPPAPPVAPAPSVAENPVIRGQEGDYGLIFRFGGLSTLSANGVGRIVGDPDENVFLTQVGLKKVYSETWMVPVYLGVAFAKPNRNGLEGDAVAGLDLGLGVEYHFRIWRRISPFVGAAAGFSWTKPSNDDDSIIGFGLGPNVGIEYYVLDRVSLQAQYLFTLQFAKAGDSSALAITTLSGGALNLTFYF